MIQGSLYLASKINEAKDLLLPLASKPPPGREKTSQSEDDYPRKDAGGHDGRRKHHHGGAGGQAQRFYSTLAFPALRDDVPGNEVPALCSSALTEM